MKVTCPISKSIAACMAVALFSFFAACKKDSDNNPNNSNPDLATVSTDRVESITFTSATVVSTVSKEGKSAVVGMGIAYGKNPNPTVVADNFIPRAAFGVGTFTTELSNLEPGTKYYVRTYATNAVGTAYGEQKSFSTQSEIAPTLTTNAISDISFNGATTGGTITDQGSSPITERGIVWSKSPDPILGNATKLADDNVGTGSYSLNAAGLEAGTTYYLKAYATNSQGTGYGNENSFTTPAYFTNGSGVNDIDGNSYSTIIINGQEWMASNLRTSRYRDGSAIPTGLSNNAWQNTTAGAYDIYNFMPDGKLYNFYAVADSRGLCPAGWHVPSDAEWTTLENFLGGQFVAGDKMKTGGGWYPSSSRGTNESGFSGFPGGSRDVSGDYDANSGKYGNWWSSTETSVTNASYLRLYYNSDYVGRFNDNKKNGFSVRCLKD